MHNTESETRARKLGITEAIYVFRVQFSVALLVAVFLAGAYVLVADKKYRSDIFVVNADLRSSLNSQGTIEAAASIAGVSIPSATQEQSALLRSKWLVKIFVERNHICPEILQRLRSRVMSFLANDQLDERDCIKYFDEKIRFVSEDRKSGLISLSIIWNEPDTAARFSNDFISLINEEMRNRAISDAKYSIALLEEQLPSTQNVTTQQAIGRAIESNMQKLVMAKSREQFSYRVIDPAFPPKRPFWPKPFILIFLAGVFGVLLIGAWKIISGKFVLKIFRFEIGKLKRV